MLIFTAHNYDINYSHSRSTPLNTNFKHKLRADTEAKPLGKKHISVIFTNVQDWKVMHITIINYLFLASTASGKGSGSPGRCPLSNRRLISSVIVMMGEIELISTKLSLGNPWGSQQFPVNIMNFRYNIILETNCQLIITFIHTRITFSYEKSQYPLQYNNNTYLHNCHK